MKDFFAFLFETAKIIVLALIIVLPVRYFLFQPFFVQGASMEPNFHDGDYLIVDEITYRFSDPQRGDVVVFEFPDNPSQRYIKRIIGIPGEKVQVKNGRVVVDGQTLDESGYLASVFTAGNATMTLGDDEYFVLGDNRPFSSDSRSWGVVPENNIIGRVYLRAWPFTTLAKVEAPSY